MSFDIDDSIESVVEAMRYKHPNRRPSSGERFEQVTKMRSRDYDVRDRLERQRKKPMRVVGLGEPSDYDHPKIVLPDSVRS